MSRLHPVVAEVTARIVERSKTTRADYLRRMDAARASGAGRAKLSCANWAHAFAGQTITDKLTAMGLKDLVVDSGAREMKQALADCGVEVRMSKAGVELLAGPQFDAAKFEALQ